MSDFTKKIITSLLPKGSAWRPEVAGDFDKYLEGQAVTLEDPITFLKTLADIRNPLKTPLLDELEIEFGVTKNENLTEQERREFLTSFIVQRGGNGTADDLEFRLNQAGFPVQIHANDPAINPAVIIDQQFKMVAGGSNAYAGREDAFARRVGGELIVNGDQFEQRPNYTAIAGGANAFAGNASFVAGTFDGLVLVKIVYNTPEDPDSWAFVFFIGGDVVRDMNGFIETIERVVLPLEVREEFLQILLKYKPLYTWGVSVVDFA